MAIDMKKYAADIRAEVERNLQAAEEARREFERTGKRPPMVIWPDDVDMTQEELNALTLNELYDSSNA